jgi:hypothetical protein
MNTQEDIKLTRHFNSQLGLSTHYDWRHPEKILTFKEDIARSEKAQVAKLARARKIAHARIRSILLMMWVAFTFVLMVIIFFNSLNV